MKYLRAYTSQCMVWDSASRESDEAVLWALGRAGTHAGGSQVCRTNFTTKQAVIPQICRSKPEAAKGSDKNTQNSSHAKKPTHLWVQVVLHCLQTVLPCYGGHGVVRILQGILPFNPSSEPALHNGGGPNTQKRATIPATRS